MISIFHKPNLYFAVEKNDLDSVKALLSCDRVDVNLPFISNYICFYEIPTVLFFLNTVSIKIFLITFHFNCINNISIN